MAICILRLEKSSVGSLPSEFNGFIEGVQLVLLHVEFVFGLAFFLNLKLELSDKALPHGFKDQDLRL